MDRERSILIIDDDVGYQRTLVDILSLKGYIVSAAGSGQAALERVQSNPPIVALIDLQLSDMSGIEVLQQLKQIAPRTECILVTGYASQSSAIEAVNLGAYGYVQKPYDVEQLVLLLQRAFEKRSADAILRRVAEHHAQMLQLARSLLGALSIQEVLQQARDRIGQFLAHDSFALFWISPDARLLYTAIWDDARIDAPPAIVPLTASSLIAAVARGGAAQRINAVAHPDSAFQFDHSLCLPVPTKARPSALLLVGRYAGEPFSDEEFELTQLYTSFVSLALENARLFEHTRLSEKRYRTLFEESIDAIVLADSQGHLIDANPAAVALSGYPSRERLLQAAVEQLIVVDAGWDRFVEQLGEQGLVKDVELNLRHYDSSQLKVLIAATAMYDERGVVSAYQAIVRDVSAYKQMEEQLRQSQKMEALGRLAGGVAHDFNNLLTAIIGYGELLQLDFPEAGSDQGREVELILQAARRAAGLTRQLLAFSRQQVLQPRLIDLNEVITGMNTMLARLLGEDVMLTISLDPQLGLIRADPAQIEQVLLNLTINARDAMAHGGSLLIETRNFSCTGREDEAPAGTAPADYVLLLVRDNGQGMDAETLRRAFEPFFTTKEPGKGTGLGLATVHGIVTQSDGRISIESEPGRGTAFRVFLPKAIDDPDDSPAPEPPQAQIVQQDATVLLVEDDDLVRAYAARVLGDAGFTTIVAANGPEAIRLATAHQGPIHLLLTDVVLPYGLSGRELAEGLLVERPDLRVLYMSGYTNDAIIRHGVSEQGHGFLQKPFSSDQLLRRTQALLERQERYI